VDRRVAARAVEDVHSIVAMVVATCSKYQRDQYESTKSGYFTHR